MAVQAVKLGGRKFVIVAEKEFRDLKQKAARAQTARTRPSKRRRLTSQDRGDIAEANRREHEPSLPLEDVRKRFGL